MAASDTYNTIVISPEPRGRFVDGYISGTPKPGTVMQIADGVASVGGRFTWEAYGPGADGDNPRGPIGVLLEDNTQGKTITEAYVSGTMGHIYIPLPGDELLMLVSDEAGTGDDHTIGQLMMIDHGTGKLLISTGVESEPFILMEAATDPTADALMHAWFSGA